VAWSLAWQQMGTEPATALIWKRVAYATRYGHCGLREALSELPLRALTAYTLALAEIVEEENEANKPGA
jgi:hypothetical protein